MGLQELDMTEHTGMLSRVRQKEEFSSHQKYPTLMAAIHAALLLNFCRLIIAYEEQST